MTDLHDWLAAAARRRAELGLVRSTPVTGAAGEPALLDLAGNDYLGLRTDSRVVAGAVAAATAYGGGAGASRLVTGTLPIHAELEASLAALVGAPSALVLSTGYAANLAAVTALTDADTLVVSDAHVHASLVDACRLSRATVAVARHNDVAHVRELLSARTQPRAMVIVESVYSVLGDAAPLADLASVCRAAGAVLLVDEAHGLGVVGDRGEGLLGGLGLLDEGSGLDVVVTLTLSKSLASQGGAVLGHPAVREHLVNTARPFIYDTGLAPAACGAALAAIDVLAAEPQLPKRVRTNAAVLAEACGVDPVAGAVLSVPMPGPDEALAAVARAREGGVRIGCFRPPSTPDGISRLRLTAHADHDDVTAAAGVLREVTRG
ncbi:MAG TPA: aminotransferase class I/II-fold pyridoxal phosphate-dependent enzyme [Dermatophilaceae bacterium]|nr:aminotransferase class I/II-fold pyridoxal phosphate-dependent enzyme [Dermatophilaceae bacterium]